MKRLSALLILFAVLAGALVFVRVREHGQIVFADDHAYVDQLLATALNTAKMYGLSAHQPILAQRDLLWHSLLALAARGGEVTPIHLLAGSLASAFSLLLLVLLWRSGLPGADWRRITALALLVTSAPMIESSVSGTSGLLAAGLVLGAAMMHVRGFASPAGLLPPGAAALLGLAAWLRLECVLWWPVFCLHALIASMVGGTWRKLWLWLLLRMAMGAVLIAILAAPLFAWNMRVAGIAWPMPADAAAATAATKGAAFVAGILRCGEGWALLHRSSPLSAEIVLAFFLIGLISSLVRVSRRESDPSVLLPVVAYAVLPLLQAGASAWLGWGGAGVLYLGAAAIWLPAAVEGFWFIARQFVGFLRKAGLREDAWFTPTRAAGLLATGSVLWLILISARDLGQGCLDLRATEQARLAVMQALKEARPPPLCVATDQPGWLRARGRYEVVDLSGELSPAVRATVDREGRVDLARMRDVLRRNRAGYAVILPQAPVPPHFADMAVAAAAGRYRVCRVRNPAAP